jgi:hypothetical protein
MGTEGDIEVTGSAVCGTSSTPLLTFRTSYECTFVLLMNVPVGDGHQQVHSLTFLHYTFI